MRPMGAFDWFWMALGLALAIAGAWLAIAAWLGGSPGMVIVTGCCLVASGALHVGTHVVTVNRRQKGTQPKPERGY
jgi:hypothetical protein